MKNLPVFDYCHFCKHDDWWVDNIFVCDNCNQKYNEKPTEFKEKASVTAYRKAMETIEIEKGGGKDD